MRLFFRLRAFSDESDSAQDTARGLSIGWHLRSLAAACASVLFLQRFLFEGWPAGHGHPIFGQTRI